MLTSTPCCSNSPVKASLVNWAPWSVLKMSGLPFLRASYAASTQKPTSRVFDRHQETT